MQVIEKTYSEYNTGYDEICADLENWYAWDEIDSETEDQVSFIKYFSGSSEQYCGFIVKNVIEAGGMIARIRLICKNDFGTIESGDFLGIQMTPLKNTVIAVNEKGFAAVTSNHNIPDSHNSSSDRTTIFGVYEATNVITGEKNPCTFTQTIAYQTGEPLSCQIAGKSTQVLGVNAPYISAGKLSNNGCITTMPLMWNYSADVPDDIVMLGFRLDHVVICNQRIDYSGKQYRRLGNIMIPEE